MLAVYQDLGEVRCSDDEGRQPRGHDDPALAVRHDIDDERGKHQDEAQ